MLIQNRLFVEAGSEKSICCAAVTAVVLTPEQIVQQAFAQYIAAEMTTEQAMAAMQANLPALLTQ